ncbi:MAG: type II toxin-antitoxin system VapB family antitoxin [Deltaproteobacteria bacterium]|nr:MAG: type II toxin-antitoxin system VapB family antitoxin [Deltaproteobacteria bacterium]
MRTLIDIQDELMEELLQAAKVKTKKEAITLAIKNFIKQKKRERLSELLGRYEFGYTQKQLEEMREDG